MRNLKGLYLIFLLGMLACQPRDPELPIAEETLVPMLKDIQLAESMIKEQNYLIQDSLIDSYYGIICRTYDVKQADLDSTLAILRREPAMMDKVYTKVLEVLAKEEVSE